VYEFCLQRQIAVEGISLMMSTEKNPETKMLTEIEIEVRLPKGFPQRYEQAVIRAVDLCAVKKHLLEPPVIHTHITYP
jgi:ribosomal protein S12 methylthiotransferase accessory factor